MVILLNGSINSGKTTVGKALCLREKFAFIEVDSLRDFVSWLPLEESIELNLENAVDVAINFDLRGINSVIAYPLSEMNYLHVRELLECAGIDAIPITLFLGLASLCNNRGGRELSDWEVSRIGELVDLGIAKPDFSHIIDNSEISVDETVDKVLDIVSGNITKASR
ncbi:hypothetical protein [Photobacterium sp. OFAV2-7]|uniref:hypothetical protein n=1 Tax=Photobacterium sp. OFAV2-7 TaxID=2917748 RepID=UPI001EF4DABC|nr:hypothetical protein [Photobacterium sp. OFAV2-7]MCG7584315.1 hypothetical protein [Photobacterium sp. OFAV2-7]